MSGAMVYDTRMGKLLLSGGWTQGAYLGDLWTWDGQTWTLRNSTHRPEVRRLHVMAHDADRGATVLFGGDARFGLENDLWEWR